MVRRFADFLLSLLSATLYNKDYVEDFWMPGKLILVMLSLCLCLTWHKPVYAASPKEIGGKVLKAGKKVIMLPVYMIGGAGAGVIVWYHYGGEEGKLADLFKGIKK